MQRHRLVLSLAAALLLSGCAPEPSALAPGVTASPSASSTAVSASPSTSTPPLPAPPAVDTPSCWTVSWPALAIDSVQTPEEFARQNAALVEAGAPSPCSLFVSGSHLAEADAWVEGLIASGWTDQGREEDDVYVSRSAMDSSGLTASYLVSRAGVGDDPISQFQLYRG